MVKIGILGGSGLDDPDVLQDKREKRVTTPYGNPSDVLIEGNIAGVPCVLLARHGRKHDLMPTNVNYRANIWALKEAGCTHLVVTTACGSLKEDKHPGDLVFIDQFIDRYDPKFLTVGRLRSSGIIEMGGGILGKMADGLLSTNERVVCFIVSTLKRTRTTKRASTFFDGSPNSPKGVCHIPMHTPFCSKTRKILTDVAKELGYPFHESGTMLTIEGPRFSTKAESHLFRSWGADLINMTTAPEVVLAKEAGLCYAAIALTTDYDCWHESEEAVSTLKVLECMKNNSHKATEVIKKAIPLIAAADWTETIQANKDEVKNSTML